MNIYTLIMSFLLLVLAGTILLMILWYKKKVPLSEKMTWKVWLTALTLEIIALFSFALISLMIVNGEPDRAQSASVQESALNPEPDYEYLKEFYGQGAADTITFLLSDIDATKDKVNKKQNAIWYALQICQITLIVLGAIATAMVAIGNKIPYIAPWVIVPTTLVTIVSGINAFYDYGGSYNRLSELRASLAELQGRIIFDLRVDAITPNDKVVGEGEVAPYLVDAYKELHRLLADQEQGHEFKHTPAAMKADES